MEKFNLRKLNFSLRSTTHCHLLSSRVTNSRHYFISTFLVPIEHEKELRAGVIKILMLKERKEENLT